MSWEHQSLAEILGPWQQPDFESGLTERMRLAWTKPMGELTNQELATCLRQSIAIEHLLPIAKQRVRQEVDDGSEILDEELARAIGDSEDRKKREHEHKQIMAARFRTDDKKP